MSSSLSCGIVGLPNVGKSTLFNALTHNHALVANYPFATIEPNTGIVPVPDTRLLTLAELYHSERIVPATVTFVDIAGLVKGASEGQGLGNQFLGNIRSTDAIIHVVRAFVDDNVISTDHSTKPEEDIAIITTELVLADLETVERRLHRIQKEVKADQHLKSALDFLELCHKVLNEGTPLFDVSEVIHHDLLGWLKRELQLLTLKPIIYVFNVDEQTLSDTAKMQPLRELASPHTALFVCAKLEDELQSLDQVDADELLATYGVQESGLIQLIHAAYDVLGLQSFLTAGPKEVRAWTIHRGATAPQAAGVIHTDFERGFIAAQVVSYQDLVAAGSEAAARASGKLRTEGKDYVMQPDDVVEFRFNVSR